MDSLDFMHAVKIELIRTEVCTKSPGRQDSYAKISDGAPPEELLGQCAWTYFGVVPGLIAV